MKRLARKEKKIDFLKDFKKINRKPPGIGKRSRGVEAERKKARG